jgi:hypothetical protein
LERKKGKIVERQNDSWPNKMELYGVKDGCGREMNKKYK